MTTDPDLARLADIPDPLGGAAAPGGSVPAAPGPGDARPPAPPSPTRAQMRRRRGIAAMSTIIWSFVVLNAIGGVRAELGALPAWYAALHLALPAALSATAALLALAAGPAGLGAPVAAAAAAAVGGPALWIVVAGTGPMPGTPPPQLAAMPFLAASLPCFVAASITAAAPLALGMWAARRAFVAAAGWRAAALGAAAGLVAAAFVNLHCENPWPSHLSIAHGLPIVIAAAIGAAAGGRIARA